MSIEFILWWLLAGVIAELILSLAITIRHRSRMKKCHDKYGIEQHKFHKDYLGILINTPWWAHLIMIAVPISILLHPAICGE